MREKYVLSDWEFEIGKLDYRAKVKVPHTWNVCEETQHYRGKAEYRTAAYINENLRGGKSFCASAPHTIRQKSR